MSNFLKTKILVEYIKNESIKISIEEFNALMSGGVTGFIAVEPVKNKKGKKENGKA